jgi:hypothetical protein
MGPAVLLLAKLQAQASTYSTHMAPMALKAKGIVVGAWAQATARLTSTDVDLTAGAMLALSGLQSRQAPNAMQCNAMQCSPLEMKNIHPEEGDCTKMDQANTLQFPWRIGTRNCILTLMIKWLGQNKVFRDF